MIDMHTLRHLRHIYRNVSSCLPNVSFCPGGRIECCNMDTFEPHSPRTREPAPVTLGSPISMPFLVPASLEGNVRTLPFLISGKPKEKDETTVSSRLLHYRTCPLLYSRDKLA